KCSTGTGSEYCYSHCRVRARLALTENRSGVVHCERVNRQFRCFPVELQRETIRVAGAAVQCGGPEVSLLQTDICGEPAADCQTGPALLQTPGQRDSQSRAGSHPAPHPTTRLGPLAGALQNFPEGWMKDVEASILSLLAASGPVEREISRYMMRPPDTAPSHDTQKYARHHCRSGRAERRGAVSDSHNRVEGELSGAEALPDAQQQVQPGEPHRRLPFAGLCT